jgi:adenine phosphoribosyltransferase
MATLEALKLALRQKADETTTSSTKQPLSDAQYSAGFDILIQGSGWMTYQESIIPQLLEQLTPVFNSRDRISVLEIGPGPKSILGWLPGHLRHKVKKYTAFEPNNLFATILEDWIHPTTETESLFPSLDSLPEIHQTRLALDDNIRSGASDDGEKYDIILFSHSMYGMKPKNKFIEKALGMLTEGGLVVVFHRDGALHFDGLVCHRTASFPTGVVAVPDEDETLNQFASFVAGFAMDEDEALRIEWCKLCRTSARREDAFPNKLLFSAPDVMVTFNSHSTSLSELTAKVPLANEDRYETIKNREARLHHSSSVVRPTEIRHIKACVQWAVKHGASLTVVGGGHSGHCLWPNVVAVDMAAFDKAHILTVEDDGDTHSEFGSLVVAEAGCKTGDIIRKAMQAGLTVPLGARPSVGAGLWLQGGIGHLARLHGLACDAVVGAVVVSVKSGDVFYIGHVPTQYRPSGAIRPENEADLLWAMKGAGTNFGIVISITFKAYVAPKFLVRNWVLPLKDDAEAQLKLSDFDKRIARKLPRNASTDAYLYWDAGKLHLGVTMFEASTTLTFSAPESGPVNAILGPGIDSQVVDAAGLFETEMYVSRLHGGHGGGKTSAFKRCVFLKNIGEHNVTERLIKAIETRPTLLCYLHLLRGGGAVKDVAANATAFGCRDWDFACVITGVWPRDQDGSDIARSAVQWVYSVVQNLLPLGQGSYGADLGPDPRDAVLAAKAFRMNLSLLKRLKRSFDPHDVLTYACPISKASPGPKLIILVTGKSGTGKDYCANIWVSVFSRSDARLKVRATSISEITKREYAASNGADINLLLSDRAYKEKHRPALTAFFQKQIRQRPQLPVEHFLSVVYGNSDANVLFITGMRDEASVAAFSHLVPDSRLLEVHVQVSERLRQIRRARDSSEDGDINRSDSDYRPNFILKNELTGNKAAEDVVQRYLLPFVHEDLQRLAGMVPRIIDFPRPSTEFRDVIGLSKRPGGLTLTTSLLQCHFTGDWSKVEAVVSCEVGGIVFASPLAARVDLPLAIIREAGKLPPPTVSVAKSPSYISSLATDDSKEKRIEMGQNALHPGSSVVVVDDVLSTGRTLCAVLQLLEKAGITAENISVMVVVEFPVHRGRDLLRQRGFGKVSIQSLLVFGGA